MFSFSFMRLLSEVFRPSKADASRASQDPVAAPIREELYLPPVYLDLAI
ncbi:hypothetical protein PS880_06157 [Pseudomonas fluorescens]|uniref:Uncharacterized protein n=1 Tax=Pseudomonas fluorescens TaxID=294 RepID=A0A5E7QG21_PSEFL|nr:hypothetical protein PS880_06157 [Pseudomonas fluorescens]